MSVEHNIKLLEEASELIDYFVGTQYAKQMELMIELQDYDQLYELVRTSRYEMLRQEFRPDVDEFGDSY